MSSGQPPCKRQRSETAVESPSMSDASVSQSPLASLPPPAPQMAVEALAEPGTALARIQALTRRTNIRVTIVVSSSRKKYDVQKDLLCSACRWLQDDYHEELTQPRWELVLPHDSTKAWDIFVAWLENRAVLDPPPHNPDEQPLPLLDLAHAYVMAMHRNIDDLVDPILRTAACRLFLSSAVDIAPMTDIVDALEYLEDYCCANGPLRALILDFIVECMPRNDHTMSLIGKLSQPSTKALMLTALEKSSTLGSGDEWFIRWQGSDFRS